MSVWVVGMAGLITLVLILAKGILDQLPDLLASWRRAKDALVDARSTPSLMVEEVDEETGSP